jgi:hypothetical protein
MATAVGNILRLSHAGIVLAQHGVRFVPAGTKAPFALHLARALTLPIRALTWPLRIGQPKARRVAGALASLGPSYIKLGQFLATRADLIGPDLASDLRHLQDKLPAFSMAEARRAVEEALGGKLEDHFVEFGPPVAAASIAQVHKAVVIDDGVRREVAVKILRPNIEKQFNATSTAISSPPARSSASCRRRGGCAPWRWWRRWRTRCRSRWICGWRRPPSPRWRRTSPRIRRRSSAPSACRRSTGAAPPAAC